VALGVLTLEGRFVRIISMRNLFSVILVFAFFAGIVGCDEPVKKTAVEPVARIMLGDILPKRSGKKPTAINFKIITYQIPLVNYPGMSDAFNALTKDMMRFSNAKSFKANGFAAGLGNATSWPIVINSLRKVGGRRAKISTLTVYDDLGEEGNYGNDHLIGNISSETPTSYFELGLGSKEVILKPGLLGWRIKAHDTERRGLVQLRVQGLYKRRFDIISRLDDFDEGKTKFDSGEIIFKPTTMVMNLNVGGFVLIGARPDDIFSESTDDEKRFGALNNRSKLEPMRLVELFFRTRGTMIMPKTTEDLEAEGETGEVLYKPVKDVEIAEVFVIVNMGVEN
jgi:hypothetical protein